MRNEEGKPGGWEIVRAVASASGMHRTSQLAAVVARWLNTCIAPAEATQCTPPATPRPNLISSMPAEDANHWKVRNMRKMRIMGQRKIARCGR